MLPCPLVHVPTEASARLVIGCAWWKSPSMVVQVRDDLRYMCQRLPLPDQLRGFDPDADGDRWQTFMVEHPSEWDSLVSRIRFCESACDKDAPPQGSAVKSFVCTLCPPGDAARFACEKDLLQHQRIKHKRRNPMSLIIADISVCPSCGTDFRQRHRLLRHLTDRRRTKCQQAVLAMGLPSLTEAELQRLDAQTRELATTSRREGHSHPLASGTALTATGKRIGHALSA